MEIKNLTPLLIFNLILFLTFSLASNTFIGIEIFNTIFYIIFHITFIYFIFFHYHFSIYLLAFVYGILFDVILINSIGSHLICFLIIISIFIFIKKYLYLLSPYQISFTIFITLITSILFEILIFFILNNIISSPGQIIENIIISIIMFVPTIYVLNKIDK